MTTQRFLLVLLLLTVLNAFSPKNTDDTVAATGLYTVSVMYPGASDKTFDMNYYEKNHMPMMARILDKNLKYYEIDKGIAGRTANDKAPYVAICRFYCYDTAAYRNSIAKNIDTIRKDIAKYTNIQPVVQMSEVQQFGSGAATK